MRRTLIALSAAAVFAMPLAASAETVVTTWDPVVFWHDAPATAWERIDYLQHRIDNARNAHVLSEHDAVRAQADLNQIREVATQMHTRDGGLLNATDNSYVQGRLDNLARQIHWDVRK